MRRNILFLTTLLSGAALNVALATPAHAADKNWYVGIEGGVMQLQKLHVHSNFSSTFVSPSALALSGNQFRVKNKMGFDVDAIAGYDFGTETWTPIGPGTVRDLLPFRVFDSWVHEQDVRRALARPGDVATAGAALSLDRIEGVMPMVVGKKVAPPDGTVVAFTVSGPVGRAFAIEVAGRRAGFLDSVPAAPTVHLAMATDTFVRLASGRGDPESILAAGDVTLTGDPALGRAVAEQMNFLF